MQGIRWVWFDVGATLVSEDDCVAERCRALAEELATHGIQTTADAVLRLQIERATAFESRPLFGALEALGLSPDQLDSVVRNGRWPRELEKPFPGALEAVEQLAARFSLGVVANQAAGSRDRLVRYGFMPFFSDALLSDEVGIEKPDARLFQMILERSGVSPEQIAVVGDRLDNDVAPARALGMRTIRVLQGVFRYQQPRSPDECPDVTVARVADVAGVLLRAGVEVRLPEP